MRCSAPFRICIKRVVEAKQNQELWERSHTNQENPCKLLLHKRKNEIRCSATLRICIKRVVEAKQNQELWERSHTKPCKLLLHKRKNEIRCSAPHLLSNLSIQMLLVLWGFTSDRALTVAPGFEGFRTGFPLNDWPCFLASAASCSWFCRVSFNSYVLALLLA